MRIELKVIVLLILSMIFWSLSFVWVQMAYESVLPLTLVMLRLVISFVLLYGLFKWLNKLQPIALRDRKWFFLLALFEPFIYFMCESFGLKVVSPTLGAVIVSTIPLLTPISAHLFLKERITVFNIIGIVISFCGVTFMVLGKDATLAAPLYGIVLMFIAVLSALAYAIVLKRLTATYNAFTIITYQNGIGIFMFLPFFYFFEWQAFITNPITMKAGLAIIQLAIFASSLAFIFFTYGIQKIGVTRSNIFTNTIPVFTALFAWWLLDESMPLNKWLGIAIVITGLYISQIKRLKTNV